jgi:hypothetical protein
MKEKQAVSLETLNGLLSERQRYEQWLVALETRRANTSETVYEKVRADYQTRLKDVSDRLASRAGELRATIESLTERLEELGRDEGAQHESRQEAELRAAVGEFNDDEWRRIKQESEKELGKIAKDRTATETRLAELNRVVSLSSSPPDAPAPARTAATAAGTAAPTAAPSAPPASPAAPLDRGAVKRLSTSGWPQRDDGDTAQNVLPVSPDSKGNVESSRGSGSAAGSPFDEFAGLAQSPTGAGGTAAPPKAPPASIPLAGSAKAKRGGLPDLRTEQQKTLKCPECGAANYPTEWYCERCGGELATL